MTDTDTKTTDTFTDAMGRRFIAGQRVHEVVWERYHAVLDQAVPADHVAVPVELLRRMTKYDWGSGAGISMGMAEIIRSLRMLLPAPEPVDPDAALVEAMADAMSVATCQTRLKNIMHEYQRDGYRRNARAALAALREHEGEA